LSRGQAFLVGELVTVLVLAFGWRAGFLLGFATLAFGPVLLRGLIWIFRKPSTFDVHRLGVSELLHAVLFGALLTLSMVSSPLQI